MYLQFVAAETTFNYFAGVRSYLTTFGKPLTFYSDKFGVFRVNIPHALSGTGLTQFGRALKELDIELICAHSPQAKGRVERANQTLQDRLTKELRLRGICTVAAANAYLPEFIADYNQRFAVAPRSAESAHRPLAKGEDLERVLTLCERRTLSKNLTLSYNNVIYQIKAKRAAYTMRGAHVEVRENSNGELTIEYKQRPLEYTIYQEQEQQQGKVIEAKLLQPATARAAARPKQKRGPLPLSHPWRFFDFSENSMLAISTLRIWVTFQLWIYTPSCSRLTFRTYRNSMRTHIAGYSRASASSQTRLKPRYASRTFSGSHSLRF